MNHEGTKDTKEKSNLISHEIIGAAIEVHQIFGPGLLESIYEEALCYEFSERNIAFERQKALSVNYKNTKLNGNYRLDILVEELVIIELKAIKQMEPLFEAQLLTYLKLSGLWLGMLLNFNVPVMKNGIRRIVNG